MIIRSILFAPGNKEKMVQKSLLSGADAVVWDLEDAVPLPEKDEARKIIGTALAGIGGDSLPVYVRLNALSAGMLESDLAAVVHANTYGVMLAKTESPDDVARLAGRLEDFERNKGIPRNKIKIHCILETCLGVLKAYEIARASTRVDGVSFGAEDFTLDLGCARSRDGLELAHARGAIALAAGAARVVAIDTVFSDLNDAEGLTAECCLGRRLGFKGKFAIHPKQIEIINREYSPTEEELRFARKVVEAYDRARENNLAVITVDGKMVDPPVVERARKLLNVVP